MSSSALERRVGGGRPSGSRRARRGPWLLAAMLVAAVGLVGCGGGDGGDTETSPEDAATTIPQEVADIVANIQGATEGLSGERAAQVASAIQEVIQEILDEAVSRAGDPLSQEELAELFRQKMADAGVPLPE